MGTLRTDVSDPIQGGHVKESQQGRASRSPKGLRLVKFKEVLCEFFAHRA